MNKRMIMGCMSILMLSAGLVGCSSDDNNDNGGGTQTETYKWGTDGGLKSCDHILFTLNSATLLIVSGHCGQNRPECDFSCSNWLFAIS